MSATPGPWWQDSWDVLDADNLFVAEAGLQVNTAYIAALDPATARELIRLARRGQLVDRAIAEVKHRRDDMRWCNKDDTCTIQADGIDLALDDIAYILRDAMSDEA